MNETGINLDHLQLETDYLCLDFANTVEWHASDQPVESLHIYDDLLAWAQKIGLVSAAKVAILRQAAHQAGPEARATLQQTIALREAIYHIFVAVSAGRPPPQAAVEQLNQALAAGLSQRQLVPTATGFRWGWLDSAALDQLLGPLAYSAAELLASPDLDRVKVCEDDRGCGYLFFDTSRNGSRRWCTMASCGNRAKVRRHRRRQSEEKEPTD
jgi:predicted RNA-binding Zn ribbon-like protein